MPMYEFECLTCGECGHFIGSYENRSLFGCPSCADAQRMHWPIRGATLIGPTDTKPIRVPGTNREFTSNQELNKWAADKGYGVYSADDRTWNDGIDKIRNRAEDRAVSMGFRDRQHRMEHARNEKAKRSGKKDSKIYSLPKST